MHSRLLPSGGHYTRGVFFLALPTTKAKDVVFRFIIEYTSLRDFGPLGNK
jgi:hypothetical protein